MLPVSNDWINMYRNNLLDEALIKLVFTGGRTLLKTDIYSYKFKGKVSIINQEYPYYRVEVETPQSFDVSNIGNTCDIYYGLKVNGSDEYVKAIKMIVYDVVYNYLTKRYTILMHSKLDTLVNTFSIDLIEQSVDVASGSVTSTTFTTTFSSFLYQQLGSGNYTLSTLYDFAIRHLPPKISVGEAIQRLAFINAGTFYWGNDDKIKVISNPQYNNLIEYPRINFLQPVILTKNDLPTSVAVDYVNFNDIGTQKTDFGEDNISGVYIPASQRFRFDKYYSKNDDIVINANAFTRDTITIPSNLDETITIYNDKVNVLVGDANQFDYSLYMSGFIVRNYISISTNQISIFDVNITNSTHASRLRNYVSSYTSFREKAELNVRFNPMYELLDTIYFGEDDDYASMRYMVIEEMNIEFNGSFRATLKGISGLGIRSPIIVDYYWQSANWYFEIANPNPFPVTLVVESSEGSANFTINGKGTITLSSSNASQVLSNAILEKQHGTLDYDVICWFEVEPTGYYISETSILLAED